MEIGFARMQQSKPMRKSEQPVLSSKKRSMTPWVVAVLLAVGAFLLFSPAIHHAFIDYDDPDYVTQNQHVQSGITTESLAWAFGNVAGDATYWHPLTWISHMIDCQVFGLNPAGHHAMNILLHALNVGLVFIFLWRSTGALWRSAVVAALFAVHPLQVDTVAWVTERKNVLSTFFWVLTLMAYVRYARAGVDKLARKIGFYLLALVLLALGLMCKPMLVTVPCVLLLLDVWPLQRLTMTCGGKRVLQAVLEKGPFFVLSGISAWITVAGHKQLGLVVTERQLSFGERIINCVVSYAGYFSKAIWPTHLAIYYPIPESWSLVQILTGSIFVCAMLTLAILSLRRRPFVSVGCLWFLGTLVPVIGVLQVGIQSMADRFVYVPLLGLFIAVVWGGADLLSGSNALRRVAIALSALWIGVLSATTSRQLGYWKNTHTLFAHAANVIPNNVVAEVMLGVALEHEGHLDGALRQYEEALRLKPGFPQMHYNIANILVQQSQLALAVQHYRAALALNDSYAEFHFNLGAVLEMQGKRKEAIPEFRAALRIHPQDFDAVKALGVSLEAEGQHVEAAENLSRAVAMRPNDSHAHYELSKSLAGQNKVDEAIQQCQAALRLQPDLFEAHFALGNLLIGQGKRAEGIAHFEEALRLRPDSDETRRRLAANKAQ